MQSSGRNDDQSAGRAVGRANIWAALVTVWIVWGTTYLAIRVTVRSMPPLLSAGSRFLLAGALLYAWAIRRGDRAGDRPTRKQWRSAAIIGALLLLCSNGMIMTAEKSVPSGLTALIVAMVPLWMAFFDRLLFGRKLQAGAGIGLVTGFLGAALLVGGSIEGNADAAGTALVVAAAITWTLGSLYARDAHLPARPLVGTAMEMLVGGALLLIGGIVTGELSGLDPSTFRAGSMLALLYLVIFGSLVGFSSYVWLIRSAPTQLASTYAYVNPVVAVCLGSVILHEPLTARTALAGAIIVASVALIVTSQSRSGLGPPSDDAAAIRAASGE